MTELAKADIFFFITAVAVVIVTIVLLVALYYLIKILRDVEDITDAVKDESTHIIKDVSLVRKAFEKGGKKVKNIIKPSSKKKKKKT